MKESKELVFEPGAFMRRMFRDFDRFFEPRGLSLFQPFPALRRELGEFAWTPALEVSERDHHLYARFDLPGMKKEEVTVTLGENEVTVSGERKKESEEKKEDFFKTERYYGSFSRTIPIPEGVKPSDITATFANGVLELAMPMPAKADAAPKKIPITEGKGDTKKETKAA
jgi:HSP20 family protein